MSNTSEPEAKMANNHAKMDPDLMIDMHQAFQWGVPDIETLSSLSQLDESQNPQHPHPDTDPPSPQMASNSPAPATYMDGMDGMKGIDGALDSTGGSGSRLPISSQAPWNGFRPLASSSLLSAHHGSEPIHPDEGTIAFSQAGSTFPSHTKPSIQSETTLSQMGSDTDASHFFPCHSGPDTPEATSSPQPLALTPHVATDELTPATRPFCQPLFISLTPPEASTSFPKNKEQNQMQAPSILLTCSVKGCTETFRTNSELRRHTARHERPFRCPHISCPRAERGFPTKNDLERHLCTVHRQIFPRRKLYKCFARNCPRTKLFRRQDYFTQHIDRMHPGENRARLIIRSLDWFKSQKTEQPEPDSNRAPESPLRASDQPGPVPSSRVGGSRTACPPSRQPYICGVGGCPKECASRAALIKHRRRHDRRFGCTFSGCFHKSGSKDDWKRHERNQHYQLECWKCDFCQKETGFCGSKSEPEPLFYKASIFEKHLTKVHSVSAAVVQSRLRTQRIGRNFQTTYWCGFCAKIVTINSRGLSGDNERFDHIGRHFDQGEDISAWIEVDRNAPKGILRQGRLDSEDTDSEPECMLDLDRIPNAQQSGNASQEPSMAFATATVTSSSSSFDIGTTEASTDPPLHGSGHAHHERLGFYCHECSEGPWMLAHVKKCVTCEHSCCESCTYVCIED